jgi:low affinity Fe/Cu permease
MTWSFARVQQGMPTRRPIEMPLDVSGDLGFFDRFATAASNVASRAVFFALCVALVVVWAPSILLLRDVDTWQLIINTATTIVTFLMVALLQNTQTRSDQAIQHKLNAIADGLADLMAKTPGRDDADGLETDMKELRAAVGLETRESSAEKDRGTATTAPTGQPNGTSSSPE